MIEPKAEMRGEARCREILEVGSEASQDDIRRAHGFLKALYAPGSTGLSAPYLDEFAPEIQAGILAEIEAAFAELCLLHDAANLPPAPPPRMLSREPDRILDGPALRAIREAEGFTLERMATETSVRQTCVEALEEERYRDLPSAAVIVRGYVTAYLSALGRTDDATVADYVRRFQAWQGKPKA